MRGTELDTPAPFSAELADLAAEHRTAWLAQVLPPGSCVLWAGGPSLAATIASDGSRTVLLLEPTVGGTEHALSRGAPGVAVRHVPAGDLRVAESGFSSVVVVAGEEDELATLLPSLLARAHPRSAVAVVDRHGRWQLAVDALRDLDRSPTVVRHVLRTASCIGLDEREVTISPEVALRPLEDEAVLVVDGLTAAPSVLLGGDAGPPRWTADGIELIASFRRLDEEIGTEHLRRIQELEGALAAAAAERAALQHVADDRRLQIDALLASTSWRLSAPARWASDAVAALRGGRRSG